MGIQRKIKTTEGKRRKGWQPCNLICLRQEGKIEKMPPSYSMGERWTITMKMELRRRRLFMLFSYFSCYKKGQWNSGVWNRYLSGESESPAGRVESPDLASPLTG